MKKLLFLFAFLTSLLTGQAAIDGADKTLGAKLELTANGTIVEDATEFPYTVNDDAELVAVAVMPNGVKSAATKGKYTVLVPTECADPVFSLEEEEVEPGTVVSISCPTPGGTIVALYINDEEVADAKGKTTYDVTIYDNIVIKVTYTLEDGETSSEECSITYSLKNVEGTFEQVKDFAELNVGDQVVLVGNTTAFTVDMSAIPATAANPKTNDVTLTEDLGQITSSLTNAEIFTIASIANDAEGLEQYTFRSNVLNADGPLYLQYGGEGAALRIQTLADGATAHVFTATKSTADDAKDAPLQLYVTSTLSDETHRMVRCSNGATDWQAFNDANSYSGGKYTLIYKKAVEVAAAEAPTFTPAGGEVEAGTEVTIATPTDGALLDVVIGDEEKTGVASPYKFTVDKAVDVKAMAYCVDASGKRIAASESGSVEANYTIKEVSTWRLADHMIPNKRFFLVGKNTQTGKYFAANGENENNLSSIGASNAETAYEEKTFEVEEGDKHIIVYDTTLPYLMFEETETPNQYLIRYIDPKATEQTAKYLTNGDASGNSNCLWVSDGAEGSKTIQPVEVTFDKTDKYVKVQFIGGSSSDCIGYNTANSNIFSCYGATSMSVEGTSATGDATIFWPYLYIDADWIETPTISPESGTEFVGPGTVTITPNVENPNSTVYYQVDGGEVMVGNAGESVEITVNANTTINYWAEETITVGESSKTLVSEHLTATYTEPTFITYYRSHVVREGVDYVLVGLNNSSKEENAGYYLMTGMKSNNSFGSTHEKENEYVTMAEDRLTLDVADAQVAIVNFEQYADGLWAMKLKDGQYIARGVTGSAALSDEADPVAHSIVGDDGYQAYLIHQEDGESGAQRFSFYANGANSKFCSYDVTKSTGTPIYLYASEMDAVEQGRIKFGRETDETATVITGWENQTTPIQQTFNSVKVPESDLYIYIYYDGEGTLEQAQAMSDDELSHYYKYTDDSYNLVSAQADEAQTSPVAMHVEVEMLGGADGENLAYKKPNPDVPGAWDDQDYIKYSGVNQVYIADADKPYIKVPVISKYSIVTATATGDGITHQGSVAAPIRAYVREEGGSTGIEMIDGDSDAEVKYYNLQGVRVSNPGSGIYIRVEGNRAGKVML